MNKYEFTGEVEVFYGRELKRIKASVSFGNIKAGEVGGWIEKDKNLNAEVSGDAWVSGNAKVFGNAEVSGNAKVFGNAKVSGNAEVSGDAEVSGNAKVFGNAEVSGDASKTPICLSGLNWHVTITDNHIRIGCQFHTIVDWEKFED